MSNKLTFGSVELETTYTNMMIETTKGITIHTLTAGNNSSDTKRLGRKD